MQAYLPSDDMIYLQHFEIFIQKYECPLIEKHEEHWVSFGEATNYSSVQGCCMPTVFNASATSGG